jgi:hypothetical protein
MTTLVTPQKIEDANELSVSVYQPEDKKAWNDFVAASKNGTFLFNRDYMEYHSDRFSDHSLLFFKNGRLVGLLPSNVEGNTLFSHAGLTFGGVISGYSMKTPLMLEIFKTLIGYCQKNHITNVVYKAIPYIYHSVPADEDLYALFCNNAKLIARSVSSSLYLAQKGVFDSRRKESLRKARKNNLVVKRSNDLKTFMELAENVLMEKHGVRPLHTLQELTLLMTRFPENIKLFASYREDVMVAGIIIYESPNVAHGQYAANSDVGRSIGAQDLIEDYLINVEYKNKKYYDFGTSTFQLGRELNESLITRKEGFGSSAINYDSYELNIPHL